MSGAPLLCGPGLPEAGVVQGRVGVPLGDRAGQVQEFYPLQVYQSVKRLDFPFVKLVTTSL